MKKAIIIGSGVAGLACSIRLAKKGYEVSVIEKNKYSGGKIHVHKDAGYRFDLGPSLFTMPMLIEELFTLHNEDISKYFTYKQKEIICHYFWPDGSQFKAAANTKQWVKEAAVFFNEKENTLQKYLDKAAFKYSLTAPLFIEKSLHEFKTFLSWKTLLGILNIGRLDIFSSLDGLHKKLFTNHKLQQYFNRYATYNGSSPYKASAIMSMIPHLEMHKGTFFPTEGMHSISQCLYKLAKAKGVKFLFETEALEIVTQNKTAIGVQIKDLNTDERKNLEAAFIVSNSDVYNSYEKLLPSFKTPKNILSQERSSAGLIFYWGIKKTFPSLELHNIFFSKDYQKEFKEIFELKTTPKDPTIYLNISAKDKPTDAPSGCENWFVMINVAAHEKQDWPKLIAQAKQTILLKLSQQLGTDIGSLIESEYILDPIKIQEQTASYKGALYGTSSNDRNAAFLRQPNRAKGIKNLYFCGGSAHPGGGIPLCLQSAKIVSDLIPHYKHEA